MWLWIFGCLMFVQTIASARTPIAPAQIPNVIRLLPANEREFLMKANRQTIEKFCKREKPKKDGSEDEAYLLCADSYLNPSSLTIRLFESPSRDSKELGKIIVKVAMSGKSTISYIHNGKSTVMKPHLNGAFGLSDYFVFTVKGEKGDWLQLPQKPFPTPVWINLKEDWGEYATRTEHFNWLNLLIWNDKDIRIRRFDGDKFWYSVSESEDVDCLGENFSEEEQSALIKELYDSDGHLKVQFKFPQGC